LIEDGESRSVKGASHAVASFICDWSDKRRPSLRVLLATMLFQLLASHKDLTPLLDAFALAMMESMSSVASSVEELWELLAVVLKLCPFSTIIVDGIDEFDEDDGEWTARQFSALSMANEDSRILLLSRDSNEWLRIHLNQHPWLRLEGVNNGDIETFIASRIGGLRNRGFEPSFLIDDQQIIGHLSNRAAGMFLWARLVLDHLTSRSLSQAERTKLFWEAIHLEGLDALYSRIVEHILQQRKPEREFARRIVMWILNCGQLRVDELKIGLAQGNTPLEPHHIVDDLVDIATLTCGGLVETTSCSYTLL